MTLQRYVSDKLTHFVGRGLRGLADSGEQQYALLLNILRSGQLGTDKTKYVVYTDASKFSENEYYKPNMVCFSDIPVPDLASHFDQRHQMILGLFRDLPTMGDGDMPSLAPSLSNQQVNDLLGFLVYHFI